MSPFLRTRWVSAGWHTQREEYCVETHVGFYLLAFGYRECGWCYQMSWGRGPGEVLHPQPRVPPLNFSLEGPRAQACVVCQNLPRIQERTEPLPACLGTLQEQGVPWGTLKTPQDAGALPSPSSLGTTQLWPAAMLSVAPQESASTKEEFCG